MPEELIDTTCPDDDCRGDCVIDRDYDPVTDGIKMWKCTRCCGRFLHSTMIAAQKERAAVKAVEDLMK